MVDRFDIKRDGGLLWNPTGGSVRYADYKALETEHRLYHRDWVAECEKNKSLQTELREAREGIEKMDRVMSEADNSLNDAIAEMCEDETSLPASARKLIGHASAVLSNFQAQKAIQSETSKAVEGGE